MGAGWGLSSTSRGRGARNTRPFSSPSSPAPCLSGWAGGPARSLPCRRESQPPPAPLAPVHERRSIRRLRRLLSPRTGRLQPPPQCGQGKTPHPSQIHPRDGGLSCTPHKHARERGLQAACWGRCVPSCGQLGRRRECGPVGAAGGRGSVRARRRPGGRNGASQREREG